MNSKQTSASHHGDQTETNSLADTPSAPTTASSSKKAGLSPRAYALLSVGAAVVTITLKFTAYLLTNSVGLFSDAAESVINLIAAIAAFWALTIAARPPDAEHAFGHTKAEYFSSGFEGVLILMAGLVIAVAAFPRLGNPQPVENVGLGLAIAMVGTGVNGSVAFLLFRAARRLRSITLRADAHHLLTDVWTSVGVLVGVLLVKLTGWLILDPIVALLVAANIAWAALHLMSDTAHGLLDTGLPQEDLTIVESVLDRYRAQGIDFHALRTRISGRRRFVSMHVLMPGNRKIKEGHDICEQIELDIVQALPGTTVFTHIEPIEDPLSLEDQQLDRLPREQGGEGAKVN
jgi:cation diffusion facilitator family transporter